MANMRAIRTRIKSVESTRQITKSMKMVAASKLRKTQDSMAALRPFAETSRKMLAHVTQSASGAESPLLRQRGGEKICYVLLVGNRGLCGMYNSALVKYLENLAKGQDCFLVVSGRWGREVIAAAGIPVKKTFAAASDTPDSAEARRLAGYLRELYLNGEADKVVLVYQHYKSALAQIPVNMQLLPVVADEPDESAAGDYIFEPDAAELLDRLAELYLDSTMLSVLLEAKTGEHTARMTAMTSATDNTEELLDELRLRLNHARQSAITTEISEIAGGAAALNNNK